AAARLSARRAALRFFGEDLLDVAVVDHRHGVAANRAVGAVDASGQRGPVLRCPGGGRHLWHAREIAGEQVLLAGELGPLLREGGAGHEEDQCCGGGSNQAHRGPPAMPRALLLGPTRVGRYWHRVVPLPSVPPLSRYTMWQFAHAVLSLSL